MVGAQWPIEMKNYKINDNSQFIVNRFITVGITGAVAYHKQAVKKRNESD